MANRRTRPARNLAVREELDRKRVFQYELADALGWSVSKLLINLRKEQPEEVQAEWIRIIDRIAEENANS